jgi:diguanylate cyclase (GGDEF)-like protein
LLLIAKEYEENNDYRSSNEIYKEALRHEIQTGKRISQLKESDRDLDLKLKQIINDNEILRGELSELKSRNTKLVSKLEKTKRSYDDWKLLQKAAGAMTSTMNPDKVLDMAYDYANKLADIDFMTVGLYDSKLGKLDYMFSVKEGRRIAGHAVNVTPKTLERYLLDRESPTFIEDVVEFSYKRFRVNKFLFEGVKNLTFIPMTLDKEKIGYMGISTDYHEMESGEKIKALKILSSHFAAAYENARESKRLAKEIRIKAENQKELKRINDMLFKISRQDGLTGLYNKHALFRDLGIMVENKNMHNNICAIMVDIDYFKDYNDHYGHLAGDAALKRISEFLLKENMGIKRVYRYGGDEMLIIIDDIKDDAAVSSICSNIIKGVRGLNICHDYSQVSNNITVTVGAALHKTKYKELKYKELLNIADIALYKAKKKGRNCFEIVVKGTGL